MDWTVKWLSLTADERPFQGCAQAFREGTQPAGGSNDMRQMASVGGAILNYANINGRATEMDHPPRYAMHHFAQLSPGSMSVPGLMRR
jgi:hypothetical protein